MNYEESGFRDLQDFVDYLNSYPNFTIETSEGYRLTFNIDSFASLSINKSINLALLSASGESK